MRKQVKEVSLESILPKQNGYVMRNESNGIEVECTKEFVSAWEQRGFKIVREQEVTLIRPHR